MDIDKARGVIALLEDYVLSRDLSLYIVGSVAYRGALSHPELFSACDDLDCVIIYDRLPKLADFPFLRDSALYARACEDLENGRAQLFASKQRMDNIRLSLDFISLEYFESLAQEAFLRQNAWRVKLTDAVEKETNEYRSFYGASYTYHKKMATDGEYYYYTLPIHLWEGGEYYTGALYNKFIHNPHKLKESPKAAAAHRLLLRNYSRHFHYLAKERPEADIFKAMLFRKRFSQETLNFIENIKKLNQDGQD